MSRIAVTAIASVPSLRACVGAWGDGYLLGMAIKQKLARKAVKTTAKHTARGTVSKLTREPGRAATLIGIGALAGAAIGWLVGRGGEGGSGAPQAAAS